MTLPPPADYIIVPVPIRHDLTVYIAIPPDLSKTEAAKASAVILAMATPASAHIMD